MTDHPVYPNPIKHLSGKKCLWALPSGTPFNNDSSDIGRPAVMGNNPANYNAKFGNYTISSCEKYLLRSELLEVMDEQDLITIRNHKVDTFPKNSHYNGEGATCSFEVYEKYKDILDDFFKFSIYDDEYATYVYETILTLNKNITEQGSMLTVNAAIGTPKIRMEVSQGSSQEKVREYLNDMDINFISKKGYFYLDDDISADVLVLTEMASVNMVTLSANHDNSGVIKYINEGLGEPIAFKNYKEFLIEQDK